jgi:SAM-dependent methyltransferase
LNFWDERYGAAADSYVFGTEPNDFLAAHAHLIPPGPVLCLAEGEGRNAVFLAQRGHAVTALDQSAVGLTKARQLAAERGVTIETAVIDLAAYTISPGAWAGIVAIFAHLPVPLRRQVMSQVVAGLRPGGVYLTEVYSPAQLAFGTGGPKDLALLVPLADLRAELAGLHFLTAREIERDVIEGSGHTGRASVVQVAAVRRAFRATHIVAPPDAPVAPTSPSATIG